MHRTATALECVIGAARLQSKLTLASPFALAGWVVTPAVLMGVLVLNRNAEIAGPEATRIFTGVLLAAFWAASVWGGVGVLRRDRQNGTLWAAVASTQDARLVLLGRVAGACVTTLAGTTVTVTLTALILGLRPQLDQPIALVVGLMAAALTGTAASMLVGGILLVSRHGDHISNALGVPVTLLGGTVIPLSFLPDPVTLISSLISLSWLQRFLSSTASDSLEWLSLLVALCLTLLYGAVAALFLTRALRTARADGTLDLY
jgi:ABC-2 type transport system permease protein